MSEKEMIQCPYCHDGVWVERKYSQKPRSLECETCHRKFTIKFPWPVIKKIHTKSTHKQLVEECDEFYLELIKKLAGYKCELSGATREEGAILQTHHILHKPNIFMRYYIPNGICITRELHALDNDGLSRTSRGKLETMIRDLRGQDIYEKLRNEYIRSQGIKVDLHKVRSELLEQLKRA